MSTKTIAIDPITIFQCLQLAEEQMTYRGRAMLNQEAPILSSNLQSSRSHQWQSESSDQLPHVLLRRYHDVRHLLAQVKNLKGIASDSIDRLNALLTAEGFAPSFSEPFASNDFGCVAILDKWVQWVVTAEDAQVYVPETQTSYAGFALPSRGAAVWDVHPYPYPLAQIYTTSKESLWLMMVTPEQWQSLSEATLIDLAWNVMATSRTRSQWFAGVIIPNVGFEYQPVLDSLAITYSLSDGIEPIYRLQKMVQQFKYGQNREGARARVATAMELEELSLKPIPLQFDQPFIGWFTQRDMERMPMALFLAYYDSWGKQVDLAQM